MEYTFSCHGHENILATHRTTFEITAHKELSKDGDCIIGVGAEYDVEEIRKFLHADKLRMTLSAGGYSDSIIFTPNKEFLDNNEIVVRLGEFLSSRTLGTRADKASVHLNKDMMKLMKNPEQKMEIKLETYS